MTRKKILFTIPNFDTAGSGLVVLGILSRLDRSLFEPMVCVLRRGGLDTKVEEMDVPLLCSPFALSARPRTTLLGRAWAASRRFRGLGVDVWHSWHYADDYTEPLVARLASASSWIYTKKSLSWGGNAWRLRSLLAKRIVVDNPIMCELFFSSPLYRSKLRVITHGVDTERFRPRTDSAVGLRRRFEIPPRTPLVGCIAALAPVKEHPTVLRALAVCRSRPHLILVGSGDKEYVSKLTELADSLGVASRAHFLGQVANDELPAMLREIDVVVLASRSEGMGVSLLEAMACETPCVATRSGGAEIVISDGKDGFLVAVGDVASLAERIDLLATNPEVRRRMGSAAREKVVLRFNAKSEAAAYEDIYRELTGLA